MPASRPHSRRGPLVRSREWRLHAARCSRLPLSIHGFGAWRLHRDGALAQWHQGLGELTKPLQWLRMARHHPSELSGSDRPHGALRPPAASTAQCGQYGFASATPALARRGPPSTAILSTNASRHTPSQQVTRIRGVTGLAPGPECQPAGSRGFGGPSFEARQ